MWTRLTGKSDSSAKRTGRRKEPPSTRRDAGSGASSSGRRPPPSGDISHSSSPTTGPAMVASSYATYGSSQRRADAMSDGTSGLISGVEERFPPMEDDGRSVDSSRSDRRRVHPPIRYGKEGVKDYSRIQNGSRSRGDKNRGETTQNEKRGTSATPVYSERPRYDHDYIQGRTSTSRAVGAVVDAGRPASSRASIPALSSAPSRDRAPADYPVPQRSYSMSTHVPSQFSGQPPAQTGVPFPYGQPSVDRPFGAAAEFYGDQGESVLSQPGVRPVAPLINAQPHLMTPSTTANPPPETGNGAAAEFYADDSQNQSIPPKPPRPFTSPGTFADEAVPMKPPRPALYHSDISASNPASVHANGQTLSLNHQVAHMEGLAENSAVQQAFNASVYANSSGLPSSGHMHGHSASAPAVPTLGTHTSSTYADPAKPGMYSPLPPKPNAGFSTAAACSSAAQEYGAHHSPPHHHTSVPTGAYHGSLQASGQSAYSSPGAMAFAHQHRGPLSRFVEWWKDYEDIRKMEEYTEYIGVCRDCFDPSTNPGDGPRRHQYSRRRSDERLRRGRVDKESRYSSSDNEGKHRRKAGNGITASIAGIGLAKVGKALFTQRNDFQDTYSVRSGHSYRSSQSSSHVRRSHNRSTEQVIDVRHRTTQSRTHKEKVDRFNGSGIGHGVSRAKSRSRSTSGSSKGSVALDAISDTFAPPSPPSHRRHTRRPEQQAVYGGSYSHGKRQSAEDTLRVHRNSQHSLSSADSNATPSSPVKAPSGFFSGFFGNTETQKRAYKRPRSPPKRRRGFFSFGSSSSSDGLAYGSDYIEKREISKARRKTSDEKLEETLKALSATAGAIAAVQSNRNNRRKNNHRRALGRTKKKGKRPVSMVGSWQSSSASSEDGWESASEAESSSHSSSVDSALAFGDFVFEDKPRSRPGSVISNESAGTSKWSWRWGNGKKKSAPSPAPSPAPSRQHEPVEGSLYAGSSTATGTGHAASTVFTGHAESSVSSATSIPTLQTVYPKATADPAYMDVTRRSSSGHVHPIVTSRLESIPLRQPRPITPVPEAVYNSGMQSQSPTAISSAPPRFPDSQSSAFGRSPVPAASTVEESRRSKVLSSAFSWHTSYSSINHKEDIASGDAAELRLRDTEKRRDTVSCPPGVRFELTEDQVKKERRRDQLNRAKRDSLTRSGRLDASLPYEDQGTQARRGAQSKDHLDYGAFGKENVAVVGDTTSSEATAKDEAKRLRLAYKAAPAKREQLEREIMEIKMKEDEVQKAFSSGVRNEPASVKENPMPTSETHQSPSSSHVPNNERSTPDGAGRRSSEAVSNIARRASNRILEDLKKEYEDPADVFEDFERRYTERPVSAADISAPPELLDKSAGPPPIDVDAGTRVHVYNAHAIETREPPRMPPYPPDYSFIVAKDVPHSARMAPPYPVPEINLIKPTPPASYAGSIVGRSASASPLATATQEVKDEKEGEEIPQKEAKVSWGEPQTFQYEIMTPESSHDHNSPDREYSGHETMAPGSPSRNEEEATPNTLSVTESPKQEPFSTGSFTPALETDEQRAEDEIIGHIPTDGEKVYEAHSPEVEPVVIEPGPTFSFRRRPMFYRSPYCETVSDLTFEDDDIVPGNSHGFVEGEIVESPVTVSSLDVLEDLPATTDMPGSFIESETPTPNVQEKPDATAPLSRAADGRRETRQGSDTSASDSVGPNAPWRLHKSRKSFGKQSSGREHVGGTPKSSSATSGTSSNTGRVMPLREDNDSTASEVPIRNSDDGDRPPNGDRDSKTRPEVAEPQRKYVHMDPRPDPVGKANSTNRDDNVHAPLGLESDQGKKTEAASEKAFAIPDLSSLDKDGLSSTTTKPEKSRTSVGIPDVQTHFNDPGRETGQRTGSHSARRSRDPFERSWSETRDDFKIPFVESPNSEDESRPFRSKRRVSEASMENGHHVRSHSVQRGKPRRYSLSDAYDETPSTASQDRLPERSERQRHRRSNRTSNRDGEVQSINLGELDHNDDDSRPSKSSRRRRCRRYSDQVDAPKSPTRSSAVSEPVDIYDGQKKSRRRTKSSDRSNDGQSVTSSPSRHRDEPVKSQKERKSGLLGFFGIRKSSDSLPQLSRTGSLDLDPDDEGGTGKKRRRHKRRGSTYGSEGDDESLARSYDAKKARERNLDDYSVKPPQRRRKSEADERDSFLGDRAVEEGSLPVADGVLLDQHTPESPLQHTQATKRNRLEKERRASSTGLRRHGSPSPESQDFEPQNSEVATYDNVPVEIPLPASRPETPHTETPLPTTPSLAESRAHSTTAIPFKLRFGRSPVSPTFSRRADHNLSSPLGLSSAPSSPSSTRSRHRKSSSADFKHNTESFRPLYLVEVNRKSLTHLSEPEEESLPALPSSREPSRSPSLQGTEEDWESARESPSMSGAEQVSESSPEMHDAEEGDYLGSGQTTPKAMEFPVEVTDVKTDFREESSSATSDDKNSDIERTTKMAEPAMGSDALSIRKDAIREPESVSVAEEGPLKHNESGAAPDVALDESRAESSQPVGEEPVHETLSTEQTQPHRFEDEPLEPKPTDKKGIALSAAEMPRGSSQEKGSTSLLAMVKDAILGQRFDKQRFSASPLKSGNTDVPDTSTGAASPNQAKSAPAEPKHAVLTSEETPDFSQEQGHVEAGLESGFGGLDEPVKQNSLHDKRDGLLHAEQPTSTEEASGDPKPCSRPASQMLNNLSDDAQDMQMPNPATPEGSIAPPPSDSQRLQIDTALSRVAPDLLVNDEAPSSALEPANPQPCLTEAEGLDTQGEKSGSTNLQGAGRVVSTSEVIGDDSTQLASREEEGKNKGKSKQTEIPDEDVALETNISQSTTADAKPADEPSVPATMPRNVEPFVESVFSDTPKTTDGASPDICRAATDQVADPVAASHDQDIDQTPLEPDTKPSDKLALQPLDSMPVSTAIELEDKREAEIPEHGLSERIEKPTGPLLEGKGSEDPLESVTEPPDDVPNMSPVGETKDNHPESRGVTFGADEEANSVKSDQSPVQHDTESAESYRAPQTSDGTRNPPTSAIAKISKVALEPDTATKASSNATSSVPRKKSKGKKKKKNKTTAVSDTAVDPVATPIAPATSRAKEGSAPESTAPEAFQQPDEDASGELLAERVVLTGAQARKAELENADPTPLSGGPVQELRSDEPFFPESASLPVASDNVPPNPSAEGFTAEAKRAVEEPHAPTASSFESSQEIPSHGQPSSSSSLVPSSNTTANIPNAKRAPVLDPAASGDGPGAKPDSSTLMAELAVLQDDPTIASADSKNEEASQLDLAQGDVPLDHSPMILGRDDSSQALSGAVTEVTHDQTEAATISTPDPASRTDTSVQLEASAHAEGTPQAGAGSLQEASVAEGKDLHVDEVHHFIDALEGLAHSTPYEEAVQAASESKDKNASNKEIPADASAPDATAEFKAPGSTETHSELSSAQGPGIAPSNNVEHELAPENIPLPLDSPSWSLVSIVAEHELEPEHMPLPENSLGSPILSKVEHERKPEDIPLPEDSLESPALSSIEHELEPEDIPLPTGSQAGSLDSSDAEHEVEPEDIPLPANSQSEISFLNDFELDPEPEEVPLPTDLESGSLALEPQEISELPEIPEFQSDTKRVSNARASPEQGTAASEFSKNGKESTELPTLAVASKDNTAVVRTESTNADFPQQQEDSDERSPGAKESDEYNIQLGPESQPASCVVAPEENKHSNLGNATEQHSTLEPSQSPKVEDGQSSRDGLISVDRLDHTKEHQLRPGGLKPPVETTDTDTENLGETVAPPILVAGGPEAKPVEDTSLAETSTDDTSVPINDPESEMDDHVVAYCEHSTMAEKIETGPPNHGEGTIEEARQEKTIDTGTNPTVDPHNAHLSQGEASSAAEIPRLAEVTDRELGKQLDEVKDNGKTDNDTKEPQQNAASSALNLDTDAASGPASSGPAPAFETVQPEYPVMERAGTTPTPQQSIIEVTGPGIDKKKKKKKKSKKDKKDRKDPLSVAVAEEESLPAQSTTLPDEVDSVDGSAGEGSTDPLLSERPLSNNDHLKVKDHPEMHSLSNASEATALATNCPEPETPEVAKAAESVTEQPVESDELEAIIQPNKEGSELSAGNVPIPSQDKTKESDSSTAPEQTSLDQISSQGDAVPTSADPTAPEASSPTLGLDDQLITAPSAALSDDGAVLYKQRGETTQLTQPGSCEPNSAETCPDVHDGARMEHGIEETDFLRDGPSELPPNVEGPSTRGPPETITQSSPLTPDNIISTEPDLSHAVTNVAPADVSNPPHDPSDVSNAPAADQHENDQPPIPTGAMTAGKSPDMDRNATLTASQSDNIPASYESAHSQSRENEPNDEYPAIVGGKLAVRERPRTCAEPDSRNVSEVKTDVSAKYDADSRPSSSDMAPKKQSKREKRKAKKKSRTQDNAILTAEVEPDVLSLPSQHDSGLLPEDTLTSDTGKPGQHSGNNVPADGVSRHNEATSTEKALLPQDIADAPTPLYDQEEKEWNDQVSQGSEATGRETVQPTSRAASLGLRNQETDREFTATLAAGLEGSGFDPRIVLHDPIYRSKNGSLDRALDAGSDLPGELAANDANQDHGRALMPVVDIGNAPLDGPAVVEAAATAKGEDKQPKSGDLDFTEAIAAGLEGSGFDPNIVLNDPLFNRSGSPSSALDSEPDTGFVLRKRPRKKRNGDRASPQAASRSSSAELAPSHSQETALNQEPPLTDKSGAVKEIPSTEALEPHTESEINEIAGKLIDERESGAEGVKKTVVAEAQDHVSAEDLDVNESTAPVIDVQPEPPVEAEARDVAESTDPKPAIRSDSVEDQEAENPAVSGGLTETTAGFDDLSKANDATAEPKELNAAILESEVRDRPLADQGSSTQSEVQQPADKGSGVFLERGDDATRSDKVTKPKDSGVSTEKGLGLLKQMWDERAQAESPLCPVEESQGDILDTRERLPAQGEDLPTLQEPTWSFANTRDSVVHVADSPSLSNSLVGELQEHQLRDSGYHDAQTSLILPSGAETNAAPLLQESLPHGESNQPSQSLERDNGEITMVHDPAQEQQASLEPSKMSTPTETRFSPPLGSLDRLATEGLDSTSKARSSYSFRSPPEDDVEQPSEAPAAEQPPEVSEPEGVQQEETQSPGGTKPGQTWTSIFGDPDLSSSKKIEPSTPPRHYRSPSTPLDTIREHSSEGSPLRKKAREIHDVGMPERGVKTARRSATPIPFQRRSKPLEADAPLPDEEGEVEGPSKTGEDAQTHAPWASMEGAWGVGDIDRGTTLSPARRFPSPRETVRNVPSRQFSPSVQSERSASNIGRLRSPDPLRPLSSLSSMSQGSATPPLRRVDRSLSGDLRAAARLGEARARAQQGQGQGQGQGQAGPQPSGMTDQPESRAVGGTDKPLDRPGTPEPQPLHHLHDPANDRPAHAPPRPTTPPSDNRLPPATTRSRGVAMADVYEGWGDAQGSPGLSPTRPASIRKRQSLYIVDLQHQLDQLASENRALQEERARTAELIRESQHQHQANNQVTAEAVDARDRQLRANDAEITRLRQALAAVEKEVARLTEENSRLSEANKHLVADTNDRYATLLNEREEEKKQLREATESLEALKAQHSTLTAGVEEVVRQEIGAALDDRNEEIDRLNKALDAAVEQIKSLQKEIIAYKRDQSFLTVRDEDYFDSACQQLCQHVQQWVLRFSKFSDTRACRLTSDLQDEKIEARLDNAVLDGSDVDQLLADRVRRRDVFMSVVMTMVWEYIFTRYLFGMDRDQRQRLKQLEKTLSETGPPRAVALWRAITLTLLSKREAFLEQRKQDTEAVVQEIYTTLATLLPPPPHLERQILDSLRNVMRLAVDLSIEMRTQRAEYIMLPPLQPEYDENGDLVRKVYFNAALMNERSGDTTSNAELEARGAVVKIVLFPLVVKKGDGLGDGEDEIVVCPAQVLVATPAASKKVVRVLSGAMDVDHPQQRAPSSNRSVMSDAMDMSVV